MKRFHVHLHVDDLARNLGFYSKLFGAEPTRVEADYAKWMLQDPPLNFAISTRGSQPGIDHLGIQTDDPAELDQMKTQAASADAALLDEGATSCCYARSEKHWVTDPQGIAWEQFHTLGNIPVFNEAPPVAPQAAAPSAKACCPPAVAAAPKTGCCG
jgi:catechol 2,3-dioxygenase-like lactoylglutathione lyase family enzyme